MPQPGQTADFFRQPLAEMIDLHHPLAVLASRLPLGTDRGSAGTALARQAREGRAVAQDDLFGPSVKWLAAQSPLQAVRACPSA